MKRIKLFAGITMLLSALFCMRAAAASASLSGASSVRAGDTFTLTYSISGSNVLGASGELSYDASKMTLTGTKKLVSSPWEVEFSGNSVVAYDNQLTSPINGSKKLFSATFQVKTVPTGTVLTVFVKNAKTSNGSTDSNIGTVSWSATVVPPLSGNTNLASLTVSNAVISPAFSAGITGYTASVPFEVTKLQIAATAEDSKSKVSVSSPNLTPNGTTNVTVTVTAESGVKKTYTIQVKRARDPNYQPSANNNLSSIKVNGYVLSPPFSADITQYVVWLPYETENVSVSGTTKDSKASVSVEGGSSLEAGKSNEIKVICTAENGAKKEYIVVAKRASKDGSEIKGDTMTTTAASVTQPVSETPQDASSNGVQLWLVIALCLLFTAIGAAAMWGLFQTKLLKH